MSRLCAFLLIPVLLEPVLSVTFYLPVSSRKCLREHIHTDVLVSGENEVSEKKPQNMTNLKIEKASRLEATLRHLEHLSHSMADDLTYFKKRGMEMRRTKKSTSTRIHLFSSVSICCLAMATWQILYLRRFFKTKKLIECFLSTT